MNASLLAEQANQYIKANNDILGLTTPLLALQTVVNQFPAQVAYIRYLPDREASIEFVDGSIIRVLKHWERVDRVYGVTQERLA